MYALPSLSISSAKIFSAFDPVAAMRKKLLEPIKNRINPDSSFYSQIQFSETALCGHHAPQVRKILNALRKGKLEGYKLFRGEAIHHQYEESNGYRETIRKQEVFRLKNHGQGVELEFRLSSEEENARYVHILFFKRDPMRQGSFHENKRLLVIELGDFFLDVLGYDYLFGRATWSSNSEVRRPCPKNQDWRYKRVYSGLNGNLEPIFISGIQLMYLRMGFLPMNAFVDNVDKEMVVLLSTQMEEKIKDSVSKNDWLEINKYQTSQNKRWRDIVRSREAEIGEEELQTRKNRSLKILSSKDW